jgi:hypothetical protein
VTFVDDARAWFVGGSHGRSAWSRGLLVAGALCACGGPSGGGGDDDATGDGGAGSGDGGMPVARCDRPALRDVSSPTTVVGSGTPASCTAAALQQVATAGGTIVFRCGASPVTITVTSQITFTKETVLDGGGLVTLSGGGTSRILYLDSGYDTPTPRLTVQRLTFRDGRSPAVGPDTARSATPRPARCATSRSPTTARRRAARSRARSSGTA